MSSHEEPRSAVVQEERRGRSPLDQLPPPANSTKPLTPFSIEDILSKPSVRRSSAAAAAAAAAAGHLSPREKLLQPPAPQQQQQQQHLAGLSLATRPLLGQTSPLCALEELASKTFRGLEVSVLQAAEGRDGVTLFGQRNAPKKRRKSRTAFTNQQIYELEKRFLYQKYLSPADRDHIAQQLGLTNAQVITWFQNRRAKLKRDLEEMKADVESAKAAGNVAYEKLSRLAELEKCAASGLGGAPLAQQNRLGTEEKLLEPSGPPLPPGSAWCDDRAGIKSCSEDEDEEIDVDD